MSGISKSILGFLDRSAETVKCLVFRGGLLHIVLLFSMACFVWPITHLDDFKDFARNRLQWDNRVDIAILTGLIFGALVICSTVVIFLRRKQKKTILDTIRLLNDWLLWALALPFVLVAGVPALERKHASMSLFVISVATVIGGVWMYRLLGRYRRQAELDSVAPSLDTDESDENQALSRSEGALDSDVLSGEESNADVTGQVTEGEGSQPLLSEQDSGVESEAPLFAQESLQPAGKGVLAAPSEDEASVEIRESGSHEVWDESVQSVSLNAAPLNVGAVEPPPQSVSPNRPSRWPVVAAWTGLIAMAAAFAHHFSRLAINNHHSFRSQMADLGYYDNIFYQSIHGNPLGCTFLLGEVHYSSHFDPLLVLLSPLYLFYPQAEGILVIQSVWLALGIVPMYLITQHALGKRWLSVLMGALLLTYAPLHGPALYDFHSLTLLGPLALWLMYALQRRAWRWFYVVLVLCLLTREDISFVMFFGWRIDFIFLQGRRTKARGGRPSQPRFRILYSSRRRS